MGWWGKHAIEIPWSQSASTWTPDPRITVKINVTDQRDQYKSLINLKPQITIFEWRFTICMRKLPDVVHDHRQPGGGARTNKGVHCRMAEPVNNDGDMTSCCKQPFPSAHYVSCPPTTDAHASMSKKLFEIWNNTALGKGVLDLFLGYIPLFSFNMTRHYKICPSCWSSLEVVWDALVEQFIVPAFMSRI